MINPDALVPNPLASNGQHRRFYCLDIPSLEDTELTDEFYALRPHLWGLPEIHWLRERVAQLETEMTKRRGNMEHNFTKQQKPKIPQGVKS